MTYIPGDEPIDWTTRREPLGQPAAPIEQPFSPPQTVPFPAPYAQIPTDLPPYTQPAQPPLARPTSTYATLSLVFGILGLVTSCCSFGVFSLAAVLTGHAALHETKNGLRGGHGNAVAGLVLGYIVVVPAIILSIMFVVGGLSDNLNPTTP